MFSTTLLLTILGALIADSALAQGTNNDHTGLATGAIVAIVVVSVLIVIVKIVLIIYILRWYARRNVRMAAEAAQASYPVGNQYEGGYPPHYWQHYQSGNGQPNTQYGQADANGYGPGYANGINPNVKGTTQQAELAPPSYDHENGYGRGNANTAVKPGYF